MADCKGPLPWKISEESPPPDAWNVKADIEAHPIVDCSDVISSNASQQDSRDYNGGRDPVTGRFLSGNVGGPGRKGVKSKLSALVMTALVEDFAIHGAKAIEHVRVTNPEMYLKLVSSFVPKELILQREGFSKQVEDAELVVQYQLPANNRDNADDG